LCPKLLWIKERSTWLLGNTGERQHLGQAHRCTVRSLGDVEQSGTIEYLCMKTRPKVCCDGLIGDFPKTCASIGDDLAKGGQTAFLNEHLKRFPALKKSNGDAERKDIWHDEPFGIQVTDTVLLSLKQDLPRKDWFSLIQHEFWDGGFQLVKLVVEHTLLEGNPGRGFQQWGHQDPREQLRVFKCQVK